MIVEKHINEHLINTKCYKCGLSLEGARITPISRLPNALIAHTVCTNCLAESIITITLSGNGIMPVASDLRSNEMQKFMSMSPTTYDELFELHKVLKKKSIWKLLQQNEKHLEKRTKHLETKNRSQL